ncbi:MAG: hypothetical protein JKY04_07060 [Sneathiella sp.]|nr:hypothetical protein [Sneathiella sp.]
MSNFVFTYHGGSKPESAEAGAELMGRWRSWMEGVGEAMVNPGAPVGMSKTVSATGITDDGGSNPVSGYSVVSADSMDAAIEIAKGCPHLDVGTIEVSEEISM